MCTGNVVYPASHFQISKYVTVITPSPLVPRLLGIWGASLPPSSGFFLVCGAMKRI